MSDQPANGHGESDADNRLHAGHGCDGEVLVELVVGLGNPGDRYRATRHNVGFRVVDELANRHVSARWARHELCEVTSADLDQRLLLARPLTYMNRSGLAVAWLLDHLELEPEQMLVAVDDVDLPLGTLRLRRSGGPGTHNGLRDICTRVGGSFPRIRLGVGTEPAADDLADFVLSPFSSAEESIADRMVGRAADAVETAILSGLLPAMSRYNGPPAEEIRGSDSTRHGGVT